MYPQCLTIDFHSHVLQGMDDGSQNSDMSIEMLRRMGQQGIHIVAATPHFYGYREGVDSFLQRRAARWERLNQKWENHLPRVVLGAEVACFSGMLEIDGLEQLCYQGTNTLLLELPFSQWTETELDIVSTLCLDRGYRVILAHFERYIGVQKNKYIAARLQELPVWIQINAGSLLPWTRRGKCINMFLENRAHLLGSDSHNLADRRPNLNQAREMLEKKAGDQVLRQIDICGMDLLGLFPAEVME